MTAWEQQIEEDLDWRTAEIAALKHQIVLQTRGSVAEQALLRAIWAMLYAHYEGFCKFVINVFVDEIERRKTQRVALDTDLAILSLEGEFRRFRGDTSSAACFSFFSSVLPGLLSSRAEFDRDKKTNEFQIKGESNLYPEDLAANCKSLQLNHDLVQRHHQRLSLLVIRRNGIAHGRKVVVQSLQDLLEFHDAVLDVMHEVALSAIDSLDRKSYLASVPEFEI